MNASSLSSRLAFRLLCGTLWVMAPVNMRVAIEPDTAMWVGALLLVGMIVTRAALVWRRRRPEDARARATRGRRKENLVANAA